MPRSGAPKKFSECHKRYFARKSKENPSLSSVELAAEINKNFEISISAQHLRKVLLSFGLKSYRAISKPLLTRHMRKKRLDFATEMVKKDDSFWQRVIFSDESYIALNLNTTMNRVRRFRSSNPLASCYLRSKVRHPIKVMIWSCFNYNGVGRIHVCSETMNSTRYLEVLEDKLLSSIEDFNVAHPIHLDDSAPCHRTLAVKRWHADNQIGKIDWPGNSPDLNPIENLWVEKKRYDNLDDNIVR